MPKRRRLGGGLRLINSHCTQSRRLGIGQSDTGINGRFSRCNYSVNELLLSFSQSTSVVIGPDETPFEYFTLFFTNLFASPDDMG
jgi:hypothetical protein